MENTSFTLSWNAVDGADHYIYTASDLSLDAKRVIPVTATNDLTIDLTLPDKGHNYRAAVGAVPAGVGDDESEKISWGTVEFSVQGDPKLADPIITYPVNGAVLDTTHVTVKWNDVDDATDFAISVYDITDGKYIADRELTDMAFSAIMDLEYFHQYRVEVGAVPRGANGDSTKYSWSTVEFSIARAFIGTPTLEATGAYSANGNPIYKVTAVTDGHITRLSAVNDNGTSLNETWDTTANGDGTITWVRTYTPDVSASGRTWTLTAWYNGEAVDTATTNSASMHVHTYGEKKYRDAHPHQYYQVCTACGHELLLSNQYYTVNGTVQDSAVCNVCHGNQYEDAEAGTSTTQDTEVKIPAIIANQVAIEQFNNDWNNIETEAGEMRIKLAKARNDLSQSYTQELVDYELDALTSVTGWSATAVYDVLTDIEGRIQKSQDAEFDRQVKIIEDQLLLSMSTMQSSTDPSFYDNITNEMEWLSLFADSIFDVGLESETAKEFLKETELDDYVESIGKDTSYVLNLIGTVINAVDIYRADEAEKSAYIALLYQYDENMRYLDKISECGIPQVEQAGREVRKKLQEAVEGSFYSTNYESASAHMKNVIVTMGEMGLGYLAEKYLETIVPYNTALKIGGFIGGALTKNTKDQINSAQELYDLNNVCTIVGSRITSTNSANSFIQLYATLENSRIDALIDLLQANGKGTLGIGQRNYSDDMRIIESERNRFNQTIKEVNDTLFQYTYDVMTPN